MQEQMFKIFEDAINEKYKIDVEKLNIKNSKELLKELEYKNNKCKIERLEILE